MKKGLTPLFSRDSIAALGASVNPRLGEFSQRVFFIEEMVAEAFSTFPVGSPVDPLARVDLTVYDSNTGAFS